VRNFLVCVALVLPLSCQPASGRGPLVGVHQNGAAPEEPPPSPHHHSSVPRDVVERAELPYHGFRASDDTELAPRDFFDELAAADVVCVGEEHENPHDHYAELQVLAALLDRTKMNGKQLALGVEMVDRTRQPILERYRQGEIDEPALLAQSEWQERWGYDFSFYRPMFEHAKAHGLPLLGLNIPQEITSKVARKGLKSLSESEEKELPADIDLHDAEHRAWFREATQHHPPPTSDRDNLYTAQVLWDETMAETGARWLKGHVPGRQLVILAGNGHCRLDAIPGRLTRRIPAKVVSVRPMIVEEDESPCDELDGYGYAFVMTHDD
jgi:uncharacterized iron-regulated protein